MTFGELARLILRQYVLLKLSLNIGNFRIDVPFFFLETLNFPKPEGGTGKQRSHQHQNCDLKSSVGTTHRDYQHFPHNTNGLVANSCPPRLSCAARTRTAGGRSG